MQINKNITLSATSTTEVAGQTQIIAYHNATITNSAGNSNISCTIANKDLYEQNKTQVRADISEFQTAVYAVEDEMFEGNE